MDIVSSFSGSSMSSVESSSWDLMYSPTISHRPPSVLQLPSVSWFLLFYLLLLLGKVTLKITYNPINSRRIDKAAQFLLVLFAFVSLGICVTIFIQSALSVNDLCETPDGCFIKDTIIYSVLLCISLIECKSLSNF